MKKITTIIMSMVLVLMLVSCGNEAEKAKELATDFSENVKLGNVEKISGVYDIQTLLDVYNDFEERSTDSVVVNILYSYLKDITFEVHDAVANDDGTYSVDVDYTYVYAGDIIEATKNECSDLTQLNYNSKEYAELFSEIYAQNESTTERRMRTNTVTYTVKEVDGQLIISDIAELFYDVLTAGTCEHFTIYGE